MGWPGVVVLMAVESACIPVPSEIIMPFAGWMLIKERALSATVTIAAGAYGALGNTIGSAIAYGVGMWGGRPFLERYGKYVLISKHDLELADRWFMKSGSWAIFASRLLPVVRTFISLPAGIARMHFIKFLIYTFRSISKNPIPTRHVLQMVIPGHITGRMVRIITSILR